MLSWPPLQGVCFGFPTFQLIGNFDVCLLMWLPPTVAQPLVIPASAAHWRLLQWDTRGTRTQVTPREGVGGGPAAARRTPLGSIAH